MKKIKLRIGKFAFVDNEDFEELNKYKWHVRKGRYTYYAVRTVPVKGRLVSYIMHREIIKTPKGMLTDHIDGNGLNNQRKNLRIATRTENQRNRTLQKNNTSGICGVSWDKHYQKWNATIKVNRRTIPLGRFKNKKEAQKVRIIATKKYFKEFAANHKRKSVSL